MMPFQGVIPVPGRPFCTIFKNSSSVPLNERRFAAAAVPAASIPWHCEHWVRYVDRAARCSGVGDWGGDGGCGGVGAGAAGVGGACATAIP